MYRRCQYGYTRVHYRYVLTDLDIKLNKEKLTKIDYWNNYIAIHLLN